MKTFFILDYRDIYRTDWFLYELQTALEGFHRNLTKEMIRYITQCKLVEWLQIPTIMMPSGDNKCRIMSSTELDQNLSSCFNKHEEITLNSMKSEKTSYQMWDKYFIEAFTKISYNIAEIIKQKGVSTLPAEERIHIILLTTDEQLYNHSVPIPTKDYYDSQMQLYPIFQKLKSQCSNLTISIASTLILGDTGVYDKQVNCMLDYFQEQQIALKYYRLINSSLHLEDLFKSIISNQCPQATVKVELPSLQSQRLDLHIEVYPSSIHLNSTLQSLKYLKVLYSINMKNFNPSFICSPAIRIIPCSLHNINTKFDQVLFEQNLAGLWSLNSTLVNLKSAFVLESSNENISSYFILLPSDDIAEEISKLYSLEMVMFQIVDKDSILNCKSIYDTNKTFSHNISAEDIDESNIKETKEDVDMYMKDVVQICKQIKINPLSLISHHIDSEVKRVLYSQYEAKKRNDSSSHRIEIDYGSQKHDKPQYHIPEKNKGMKSNPKMKSSDIPLKFNPIVIENDEKIAPIFKPKDRAAKIQNIKAARFQSAKLLLEEMNIDSSEVDNDLLLHQPRQGKKRTQTFKH